VIRRALAVAPPFLVVAVGVALAKGPLPLQKSDFPPGAVSGPGAPSIVAGKGKDVSSTFNFRVGSREEEVTSDVVVWKTAAEAATGYRITLGAYTRLPNSTALRLPAYGDEQVAEFEKQPGMAQVIVHRGNIVWHVTVQDCGPLAPAGCLFGRTPPKLTLAQALGELRIYAARQKARIGNG